MSEGESKEAKLEGLRNLVGGWGFRALRRGRPLLVWRRSSPHNWWIPMADGINWLWHSDDYDRKLPDLSLFRLVSNSEERICLYWGQDSGLPEQSHYVLKNEYQFPTDEPEGEK